MIVGRHIHLFRSPSGIAQYVYVPAWVVIFIGGNYGLGVVHALTIHHDKFQSLWILGLIP